MSDYKNLTATECALRLLEIEKPLVLIHVRPDGDAVGSGAALCEIFRQLGKDASIMASDPIPERLKFILEYTGARIAENTDGCTAVAIDVASPTQLGSLVESAPIPTLMIDHHKIGIVFADGYIDDKASSAAEVLFDVASVLQDMNKIELNAPLAYALFAAISSDTGCFAYSNATPKTHRLAARLMECGIDTADINRRLFNSKTKEQILAEGFISSKIETSDDGRIAFATLTLNDIHTLGLKAEHFESSIDVVRSLHGAQIAFIIKETEPNKYKVSLRSTGEDVASVAARLGGGGHTRAAGCSVDAPDIEKAKDIILYEVKNI